jgi:DNA-binding NtrC family response regulator
MAATSILCVTTDAHAAESLRRAVTRLGAEMEVAPSLRTAAEAMGVRSFDVMLVPPDALPELSEGDRASDVGLERRPPVIAVTTDGSIRDAVRAIRAGASDYISLRDRAPDVVAAALQSALCRRDAGLPVVEDHSATAPLDGFMTADHRTRSACETLLRVGDAASVVLIEGEAGTGKGLLARSFHEASLLRDGPFVEAKCDGLPLAAMEREILGRADGEGPPEEGLVTRGKLDLASGGTLLLKGVANIPAPLAARIARRARPGAPDQSGSSDVRLVLTFSGDADGAGKSGPPAKEFFDRADPVRLSLPPLRDRVVDIPLLARHFAQRFSSRHRRRIAAISAAAVCRLVRYPWPGNVRELENAIEHAVVVTRGRVIGIDGLPAAVAENSAPDARSSARSRSLPLKTAMREPERQFILRALNAAHGNVYDAARMLRVSRSTLYKKTRELGLSFSLGRPTGQ